MLPKLPFRLNAKIVVVPAAAPAEVMAPMANVQLVVPAATQPLPLTRKTENKNAATESY